MKVFLSTGGLKKLPNWPINYFIKVGIKDVEVSDGKFENNLQKKHLKHKNNINLSIHNYIPFYKKLFVLNQSSLDKEIL